jgi:hypothetical protein
MVFDRGPTAGIGGMVAAWEPSDAEKSDALIRGYVRGYLGPMAAIQGEVGYWSHTTVFEPGLLEESDVQPSFNRHKLQDIPVGVSLLYFFRPGYRSGFRLFGPRPSASLYGGLGVDWHNWSEDIEGGPGPVLLAQHDDETAFGYHFVAGLEVGAWRGGGLFGEYRYTVGTADHLNGVPLKFDGSSVGGGIAVNF